MNEKEARQRTIREIVGTRAVSSQEELRKLLVRRGLDVTQSTLSRDLRELRLARIPDDQGGVRYAFSDQSGGNGEESSRRLEALLPQLLVSVEGVQVLIVARTVGSGAPPVAEALDNAAWPDVAGTIAGDNTVLIICRNAAGRERVLRRLRTYLAT